VITLVTPVPLLLPSAHWLGQLARHFEGWRYAVAYCLPDAFVRYQQLLRTRGIVASVQPAPGPGAVEVAPLDPVGTAFCDLAGFNLEAASLRQHFKSFDPFISLHAVPVHLYGDILTVAYPVPVQRTTFRMSDETQLMTLLPKALSAQGKRFRLKLIQAEAEAVDRVLETSTSIDVSAMAGSLEVGAIAFTHKRELHALEAQELALKAQSGEANMADIALSIIYEAVKANASDIHIHSEQNELVIRYRVNGRCYSRSHLSGLFGAGKARAWP
jgi:hypothetical protein